MSKNKNQVPDSLNILVWAFAMIGLAFTLQKVYDVWRDWPLSEYQQIQVRNIIEREAFEKSGHFNRREYYYYGK